MKKFIIGALAALALAGCTTVAPVGATSNSIGSKVGTSSGGTVMGLIFFGDASIKEAAKNGGIKSVSTVDQEVTCILGGLYIGYTTIVTGE